MSELQSADWSETAANNNAAAPNGWPEGQLGSSVNNCAREMMAALKRDWNRSNVTISSTGSANAYVLTYANAPTYTHGMRFSFKANFANTGAATVNINTLGAKSIVHNDGATALVANDIVVNQHVHLEYDSALDKMVMLTVPGTMVTTGSNTFAGDQTITAGALNTARATVASAATTADIWSGGNQIDWTGTTTCTGFPAAPQAGISRTLICAGAAPFTAGANMLIDGVSSGNTVTCAANDKMIVEAATTTQFRLSRIKYDGTAQVGRGGLILLQTVTASASAAVDLETGIGATYDEYVIIAKEVRPATDGSLLTCRLKQGGSYVSGASYSYHGNVSSSAAATYSGTNGTAQTSIPISAALDNTNAYTSLGFKMLLLNANNATYDPTITWDGANNSDATGFVQAASGRAQIRAVGAVQGVRFLMSAGNIATGVFLLYGVQK